MNNSIYTYKYIYIYTIFIEYHQIKVPSSFCSSKRCPLKRRGPARRVERCRYEVFRKMRDTYAPRWFTSEDFQKVEVGWWVEGPQRCALKSAQFNGFQRMDDFFVALESFVATSG